MCYCLITKIFVWKEKYCDFLQSAGLIGVLRPKWGVWASIEVQCSAGSSLISANLVLTTFPSKSENEDIAKVQKAISKDLGAHVS